MPDIAQLVAAINSRDLTGLVSQLVQIPSISWGPAGEQMGGRFEADMVQFLTDYFGRAGVSTELQEAAPGRHNVLATIPGAGPKSLVLDAHLDTVPVENMEIEPFSGEVRDGRLYGRGACDTKATLGAMMYVVALLAREKVRPPATIRFTGTVDEETGFCGITALAASGLKADGAVVGEPTDLQLVVATKGAARMKIRATGRAAHTAQPEQGHNAVYDMARVVTALQDRLAPRLARKTHPLVGSPRLTVSIIQGGRRANIVPDECTIDVDRRVLPGETREEVLGEIEAFVQEMRTEIEGAELEVLEPYAFVLGTECTPEDEVYAAAQKAVQAVLGTCRPKGVPYTTHGSTFQQMGIPNITFGAGSIDQAHTANEWVEVAQLPKAAEILLRICLTFGA